MIFKSPLASFKLPFVTHNLESFFSHKKPDDAFANYQLAALRAASDDVLGAIDALTRAIDDDDVPVMQWIDADRMFDGVRGDARFSAFLETAVSSADERRTARAASDEQMN